MTPPTKLYKYCSINPNSLRTILRAQVYYSPPIQFNDPLDCNPSLELDVDVGQLEALVKAMWTQQGKDANESKKLLQSIAYFATEPGAPDSAEFWESYTYQLGEEVKRLLRNDFGFQGVLALSEKWDEPLMWSHYAAQHQGICMEYETSDCQLERLKPVNYNAPRSIRAHDVHRWKCHGDAKAEKRVFDTYFYAKAPQWEYEKEWRDVANKAGSNPQEFDLTAVHFGMRADFVWKWMLIKTLHMDRQVAIYDVSADERSFKLHRTEVDRDEFERRGIDQPLYKVFSKTDLTDEIIRALYDDNWDRSKG